MEKVIDIQSFNFGFNKKKQILKNLNLVVPKGSIFGFLGANGAGKSTTMKAIIGNIPDKDNSIKIFGDNLDVFYPKGFIKVGSLIDYPAFYNHLSGWDNLIIISKLRNLPEQECIRVLGLVNLWENRHEKMKKYSLGMKQRLAIAMALLGNPELLILDEPVNGLDPSGMIEIRELLITLNKNLGITIFISSHLLPEIEKMVSHLAIISYGEIKFQGNIENLQKLYQYGKVRLGINNANQFMSEISKKYNPQLLDETSIEITVTGKNDIIEINKKLVSASAEIFEIKNNAGLEDWFIEITK